MSPEEERCPHLYIWEAREPYQCISKQLCFCLFSQFMFKVKTMSSLSLAWVGDASGVSL